MPSLRLRAFWLLLLFCLLAGLLAAPPSPTARTRVADGFDQPVGKPDAVGYYRARGFRANYHMGDDWNGEAGGDTDLGKPVYATAHGIVVLARDMRMGWGNLVIIRHAFLENRQIKFVDSVYAHLNKILVRENQQVVRGQQVGTIGTNRGMYPAHLHFEIRKNLNIGYNQRGFPRDTSSYYSPIAFIEQRRKLAGGGRSALVPVNTFKLDRQGAAPADEPKKTPSAGQARRPSAGPPKSLAASPTPAKKKSGFKVDRFSD